MLVYRKVFTNTKEPDIGDQITIHLEGFGDFTATVQTVGHGCATFIFDDCIMESEQGNEMLDALKAIAQAFPNNLKPRLRSLDLPTYGQIFGHDDFYENFAPDSDDQFPLMANRKNRIADYKNEWEWYWLKNHHKRSAAAFALVGNLGLASINSASASLGVRPVFLLENE